MFMPEMPLIPQISGFLATSSDGMASWGEFMRGVRAHVAGQQSLIPLMGIGVLLLLILVFNVWIARRLLIQTPRTGGRAGSGRH